MILKNSHLYSFLSQLNLENKVVFKNKDNTYAFDFHKDIKQRIFSILPDAVYIFNSQPLILFFDFTIQINRDINTLYKKVWSFDNTSIIFLVKDNGIEVFNALNYIKEENTLEPINLSNKKIKELFNIWELESGNTWKWFQEEYIEKQKVKTHRKRVNERLFSNIKEVRNYLTTNENLSEHESNSLILRIIFIRYLIDRKIKIDDALISGDVEDLNDRRKNFIQLIKEPQKLNELFLKLNNRFNGVLFKENEFILTQSQSDYLAGVFAGELGGDDSLYKNFFFEIFDFSIIPVEVISGIYESLIDDEKRKLDSAVYTPSFLVDYILKDTVDEYLKNNNPEGCIVFEVAVGSGIFLVQSLRRMIEKEIDLNGNKDKILFSEKIKSFAEKNLYGIDINPQALKVTCFSIYIALLDYLEPADINVYRFPKLIGNNLFESNFFDTKHIFNEIIHKAQPKFILGNPPWQNGKNDKIHLEYLIKENLLNVVSDFQISQSFVLRTKDFKEFNPTSSLIITSKAIHNSNAKSFKEYFLKENVLMSCLDLSPVRRFIFNDKINPAIILNFRKSTEINYEHNIVKHFSIKTNTFLKNFKILVIEKFDQKEILQKHFVENDWMFKAALYGNTLDFYFIKKLKKIDALDVFLKKNNIISGNGIKRGTPKKYFDELVGLPVIESKDIDSFFCFKPKNTPLLQKEDVFLEAGREVSLFKGDKILLKKRTIKESEISVSYTDKDLVFRDSVNAITFNDNNKQHLESIFNTVISDLFIYYQYITSSSWGVYYPEIHKTEYLSFPFVEPDKEYQNDFQSLFLKLINPLKDFYVNKSKKSDSEFELTLSNFSEPEPPVNQNILNQINSIINEFYRVKEYEKDLIDYVLNVSRYQFQESKQDLFTKNIDTDITFLKKYADVYLTEFSDIYPDEFIQIEVYPLKHFIAMNFVMKEEKPDESIIYSKNKDIESVLKTLANTLSISEIVNTHDTDKNLFIQKDIKGFEKNSFYIIKPNEYKCWHRAIAWYDVAEFKEAIQKAELNDLNEIVE